MDVDRGPELRQAPSGPGVVQVDVGHEDVAHLLGGHSPLPEGGNQAGIGALRARLYEEGAFLGPEEEAGDDPFRSLKAEIQDLYHGLSSLGPMRVWRVPMPPPPPLSGPRGLAPPPRKGCR